MIRAATLLALLLLAACEPEPIPPVQRPAFDGEAAHALLRRQVEFGPRVPGTEGHRLQLEWMLEHLRSRADTVVVDAFTHVTSEDDTLALSNVFARFRPEESHRILLLAHWDTRPRADQDPDPEERDEPVPGANDGASGTAALLHMADLMARQLPPTGVDLLLTDGEDYGPGTEDMFLGIRHFADGLGPDRRPTLAVLLDMVADADPRFPPEANSAEQAPDLVRRIWRIAEDLGYDDLFPWRVGPRVTDEHVFLLREGVPAVDIIDFEYGPGHRYWHSTEDVPAHTSASTLEAVGEVVAELIYRGG